jgi:hypothetical protein
MLRPWQTMRCHLRTDRDPRYDRVHASPDILPAICAFPNSLIQLNPTS